MNKIRAFMEVHKSIGQFFRFGLVGVFNTFLGLGLYYVVLYFDGNYLIANVISWIASVFNAFYWNNRYVFKNNRKWYVSLTRTYISYGASLITSMVLLYFLVEWLLISDIIAPVIVLIVTVPMNFVLNKFWTFKGEIHNEKD